MRDQAALLTTELVSNAVRHAGTDIELSVSFDDDVLRVEVRDQALDRAPRLGNPYGSGGYGLHIVAGRSSAAYWTVAIAKIAAPGMERPLSPATYRSLSAVASRRSTDPNPHPRTSASTSTFR